MRFAPSPVGSSPWSEMLVAWLKWSLTVVCRKVGLSAVALKDWAKKTFQLALLLFVSSLVPYQTMPTDPWVGPVSIHGRRLVRVSGPFETRTGALQVSPPSVEWTRRICWPFE
ncbi:MAG: hypothetical protein LC795_03420 [Acidobacteria bacterium]|nr:hypothetical protein [Acidobacteriota bacterium]